MNKLRQGKSVKSWQHSLSLLVKTIGRVRWTVRLPPSRDRIIMGLVENLCICTRLWLHTANALLLPPNIKAPCPHYSHSQFDSNRDDFDWTGIEKIIIDALKEIKNGQDPAVPSAFGEYASIYPLLPLLLFNFLGGNHLPNIHSYLDRDLDRR